MTKTIEIEIYDQRYTIRGDADEEYMKRLAAYVDENMRTVGRGMKTATLGKLAVLAAINITHQLFQSEERRVKGEADIEHKVLCLMDAIEEQVPASKCR